MAFEPQYKRAFEFAGITEEALEAGFASTDSCVVAITLASQFNFRCLPIVPQTKIPRVKRWPERASSNPVQILAWRTMYRCDFSILTGNGNGIWVLDVDGPRGEEDLLRLSEELGPLPRTISVISGRETGGRHLWFAADANSPDLRTVSKVLGCSFDLRGWNGQAVLSGSLHRSGSRYRFADYCGPDQVELAPLPNAWYEALPKKLDEHRSVRGSSRSRSRQIDVRIRNNGSDRIGDGNGYGGFNRPIFLNAIRLICIYGNRADSHLLVKILAAKVLNAPVDPARSRSDMERYTSKNYLAQQIERARAWCARKMEC